MRKLRIVFMGTPDFAVPSLRAIVEAGYDVAAVVTVPDKAAGRGLKMQMSPVKEYALTQNIPVLQPEKLKNPDFLEQLKTLNANLQVVVAFRMLPEAVWNMPEYGTFNLHGSLLPDYRGAAPINWAVINGETETGVTTFFLQHEIDTGDIIFQEKIPVLPEDTAGALHDRMMMVGAGLVKKTVDAIANGPVATYPQPQVNIPKPAPKIFKEDCRIRWADKTLAQQHNFVRGLCPYPAAWTILDGKTLKIYKTAMEPGTCGAPGEISTDGKTYLKTACPGGWLHLLELHLEGRKRMSADEFLRGYTVKERHMD